MFDNKFGKCRLISNFISLIHEEIRMYDKDFDLTSLHLPFSLHPSPLSPVSPILSLLTLSFAAAKRHPLNPARDWGSAVSSPSWSGTEP